MKFVDFRRLKSHVYERLPTNSVLRELILSEKDYMEIEEFLIKLDIYLKLMRRELDNNSLIG
jgi:thermostable 8-oxoguanine DNA glycosylase